MTKALPKKTLSRVVILSVAVLSLIGCEAHKEEQEILAVIETGVQHLEARDIGQAMGLATGDFMAHPGKLGRGAVARRLMALNKTYGAISILHPAPDIDVDVSNDRAIVTMPFIAVRSGFNPHELDAVYDDPEAWITRAADVADVRQVEISMIKKDTQWRVQTTRFTSAF
ncbi:MAG: hypothetical protein QNJ97_16000 [Myxococcota bacterium]|nr:hypothetical protein [Myxococcota bacterium]